MKLYLIFLVFLVSSLHSYEAEGIRMEKVLTLSASSNQEIIKISSIKRSERDHILIANTDELVYSGANRKLMTKTESSSTTTNVSKDVADEPYPNDVDIVDYTPARNKSPIHN